MKNLILYFCWFCFICNTAVQAQSLLDENRLNEDIAVNDAHFKVVLYARLDSLSEHVRKPLLLEVWNKSQKDTSTRGDFNRIGIINYLSHQYSKKNIDSAYLEIANEAISDSSYLVRKAALNFYISHSNNDPLIRQFLYDKEENIRLIALTNIRFWPDKREIISNYIKENEGVTNREKTVEFAKKILEN